MNKDCFRHAMYFGLLLGVLFFIHFAVSLLHNTSLSVMLQLVMKIVIPVVAVRFAIDCRRRVNGDVFGYSQAFRYFVILFLAASLVCSTLIFVYVQWINIDYLTDLKAQTEEDYGADSTGNRLLVVAVRDGDRAGSRDVVHYQDVCNEQLHR